MHMANLFEAYDAELKNVANDISHKTSEAATYSTSPAESARLLREVETLLEQATDLIKQMEIEVRGTDDPSTKRELMARLEDYRGTVQSLQRDFGVAKEKATRDGVLEGARSGRDRQHMRETNAQIDKQNETIAKSHRLVAETEQVALEITEELGRNRDTIQSAHAKVREVHGMTDSARRLVQSMSRRDVQQRIVIWFVALILIGMIITVVYFTAIK